MEINDIGHFKSIISPVFEELHQCILFNAIDDMVTFVIFQLFKVIDDIVTFGSQLLIGLSNR